MKVTITLVYTLLLLSHSVSKRVELDDSVDFVTAVSTFQNSNTPYASPACWLNGIQEIEQFLRKGSVLQQEYSSFLSYSGTTFCSTLNEQMMAVLAYHTTKCYVERGGKRKFTPNRESINKENDKPISANDSKMTEDGNLNEGEVAFNLENQSLDEISEYIYELVGELDETNYIVYTSFYQHIHEICIQLSQEMWSNQIEKATSDLMKSVQDIPGEIYKIQDIENQKQMEVLNSFFADNVSLSYYYLKKIICNSH